MRISQEKINTIRDQTDIVELISEYVRLIPKGSNYFGLCPFHNEKTPSFSVNPQKQIYHCFGCGAGGNVFTFLMEKENYTFIEAVKFLAERAKISLGIEESSPGEIARYREQKKLLEINREAALFFYNNIKNSNECREFLNKRRIPTEIVKKFGLGYAPDSWTNLFDYLRKKCFDEETLKKSGLFVERKNGEGLYDRFRNRIIFPIVNHMGKVIGFGGRTLGDDQPKYLNSPETSVYSKGSSLYGLNNIEVKSNEPVILVEGYMDLLAFHKIGIKNVAASLGTAFTKEQARLIRRYSSTVITAFDSDQAGIKATLKNLDFLSKEGLEVKILKIPEGMDPDDMVNNLDIENIKQRIKNPIPLIEFRINHAAKEYDLTTLEGKAKYIGKAAEILSLIDNFVLIDGYIDKISKLTSINKDVIKEEVFKSYKSGKDKIGNQWHISEKNRNNKRDNSKKLPCSKAYIKAQEDLLKILFYKPTLYKEYVKDVLTPEDFFGDNYKKLAKLVFLNADKGLSISPADFISQLNGSEELITLTSKIFMDDLYYKEDDIDKVIKDFIKIIMKESKEIKRQKILEKIKEYQLLGNTQEENKLLLKLQELLKR